MLFPKNEFLQDVLLETVLLILNVIICRCTIQKDLPFKKRKPTILHDQLFAATTSARPTFASNHDEMNGNEDAINEKLNENVHNENGMNRNETKGNDQNDNVIKRDENEQIENRINRNQNETSGNDKMIMALIKINRTRMKRIEAKMNGTRTSDNKTNTTTQHTSVQKCCRHQGL